MCIVTAYINQTVRAFLYALIHPLPHAARHVLRAFRENASGRDDVNSGKLPSAFRFNSSALLNLSER